MGLASKLAAAQAASGSGGAPQQYGAGAPPSNLQAGGGGQRVGGQYPGQPAQTQTQYQAYPGGQHVSHPQYNSPQQPARPVQQTPYQQPQWSSQPSAYPPQNTYAGSQQNTSGPQHGQYGNYGGGQQQQPYQQLQPQYGQQQQRPQYGAYGPPQGQGGYPSQGQGGYPPQGQGGYPSQGQGGYPPQGQGGYPPQGQGGYPPQGQGGYPPQGQPGSHSQHGGYGGAPPSQPAGPQQVGAYKQMLMATIQEKRLQTFYPPNSPAVDQIAQQASHKVDILSQHWRIPREVGQDIVKLALYDVILYIDDSGSMAFEENGERIDDLKLILNRVAFATSLFDTDGIQVRFMNSPEQGQGIRNEQHVNEMVSRVKFSGMTPMGRELEAKILRPLVLQPARAGQLQKPVLVITITDGQPTGESSNYVNQVMLQASQELARTRYGKGALAFQFAQVGNDLKARDFLSKLDEDPSIGDIIDCTSSQDYEVEADEMKNANPPVDLTPELWLIKLLLGAIDSSYDSKDEKVGGGARPPPQQGGYGAAQQGGYGQQAGYPPQQGGYGQQQGGYHPQQGGYGQQQGQYNRPPPQQGGYQQGPGGYQAPPPPPRY